MMLKALSRLPSLAVVPQFAGSNGNSKRQPGFFQGLSSNGHDARIELVASAICPNRRCPQAFRALRTSILLSQATVRLKSFWSPVLSRAKADTAARDYLAVTLAQLGDSTHAG